MTSSRPAFFTLSEQVKVSTMISPNQTSEILSMGSRTRLGVSNVLSTVASRAKCVSPFPVSNLPPLQAHRFSLAAIARPNQLSVVGRNVSTAKVVGLVSKLD